MKVYKVKIGSIPDCSSGFGFIISYPFATVVAAIIVSGYIYAAAKFGILDYGDGNDEGEG